MDIADEDDNVVADVVDLIKKRKLEDDRYSVLYQKPKKANKPTRSAELSPYLLIISGGRCCFKRPQSQNDSRNTRSEFSQMITPNHADGKMKSSTNDTKPMKDPSRDNKSREVIVASDSSSSGSAYDAIENYLVLEAVELITISVFRS